MKIRKCFVSNSSSSSFICEVCHECVSGMDMGLDDAEMYECVNGHTFCRAHIEDKEGYKELYDEIEAREDDDYEGDPNNLLVEKLPYDDTYELEEAVPAKYCPLCSFKEMSIYDLELYTLKKLGKTKEEIAKEWDDEFGGDYRAFRDWINKP